MKILVVGSIVALVACSTTAGETAHPKDVARYISNAENCEHLAGEWDSSLDESEQKRIERDVIRYCGRAQKQLNLLKKKYSKDEKTLRIIADYENDAVVSFSK